jgi:hypothetical protein
MPDCSVDACVTDPPYGLSFMGKAWDYDVPGVDVWREVLRVLKPGGHLLAFAGTRTQHRMAVAIEDAGFEIRDMIAWVYGSGFPKSLDVSKAIDRQRTEDKEPVRVICRFLRFCMDNQGLKSKDLTQHFGDCNPRLIDHWAARDTDSQPSLPTWEQWLKLKEVLALPDLHDAEVWRLNGRKGQPGDNFKQREVVGQQEMRDTSEVRIAVTANADDYDASARRVVDITTAHTPEAQQWAGWGTALKPALEPVTMARKPFKGTVAANVLEHGTGALNVDGCRVEHTEECRMMAPSQANIESPSEKHRQAGRREAVLELKPGGRWPANLIHDGSDEVVGLFPETPSGALNRANITAENGIYGKAPKERTGEYAPDSGSAARFFYTAKATRAERQGVTHPTVKPLDLMAYLCRLVTPPGGTVLDPFMGSGTTIKAALSEGFNAIGIEREPAYFAMAERRLDGAQLGLTLTTP